ncbi:glutamine--fructose-6-phosphate transaminase (isomerizing) [Sediminispirochaeta bajacaliforniensis]|uniref:glutamine--fructose-6-phosphate transaminase (isomerizing) n=1 Tax=Sediminispirochaeta bajacaliforniensis TaxID=148 RepID=UPI000377CEA7|nr:glutamine--fructose-6-phosphate transaminase (isomerizing) [Sediminispirochaeta bajacaliforniensis]
MCGIIGYCGPRPAAEVLLDGLKRLEYRGYDSAGICVDGEDGGLHTYKRTGKIADLRAIVPDDAAGGWGIGHTRWATHGEVNDINAHPHSDDTGKVTLVHNGIIENYIPLKERLVADGHRFVSDTDSEVIAHLIADLYQGDLEKAVREAIFLLKGTYGIAVVHADEPGKVVGARNGSPLVVGVGEGEMFLASDVTPMLAYTKQVIYLNDGEMVSITRDGHVTFDSSERRITKEVHEIGWELEQIEKHGFPFFMEKEIHEQPASVERAISGRINLDGATGHLGGLNMSARDLLGVDNVGIVAAGTSYYAGMVGAYLLESVARIKSSAELSSEVRYKNPIVTPGSLYFAVSQSGETIDTLYALRELQRKGGKVLGVCNVVGSTIARESDGGVYIHSGPEIAVASTKAFTSQISVFYIFTLLMARMRHMSWEAGLDFAKALKHIPSQIETILGQTEPIRRLAKKYARYENFLFLGRGINYPVAMEGALKLKEISYIHAEGYSAAEIKHGPIALINEQTPSLFLVSDDSLRDKVITSMKEVKARRGRVIAVAVEGDEEVADIADDYLYIPHTEELMYPFLMVVPLQLFAYYCALELGRNVDQPRNLAKSVTVE